MEIENEDYKIAYKYSIRLLSRRDYSRFKLEQKLRDRGYDRNLIDELLEELIESKYLREENYIESRVKGLIRKGWSFEKVKYHLEREKCSIQFSEIGEICKEAGIQTDEVIENQIQKKWDSSVDLNNMDYETLKKKKDKVLRYLVSKGHQFSSSKAALERFLSTH